MSDTSWEIIRLAAEWRDGRLPEDGGVLAQATWVSSAVKTVLNAWHKLEADKLAQRRAG